MADEEINYVKEVLTSNYNLGMVGVMLFLMIVVNFWGFLPLLLAGELGALFVAQHPRVKRVIRARKNKDKQLEAREVESEIVNALPANYQADFHSLARLCEEIERRSGDLGDPGTSTLLAGMVEKLSTFRHNYARMLRAHHLLSTRNYRNIETGLSQEIDRVERGISHEKSAQVRRALEQNLNVLQQRLARVHKLNELVRLLEARLQITRNSLGLIQDEVYTFTDVAGITSLVNNMLANLSLSDEFRTAYEDVLNEEESLTGISELETQLLGKGDSTLDIPAMGTGADVQPMQRERMRRKE